MRAVCRRSRPGTDRLVPRGSAGSGTVASLVVSPVDLLIAAGVALLAGGINSIAGGGSLILFPTLVALGLGTVAANVTNSVAQWPGYLGGVAGFRTEYIGQRGRLVRFGIVALLGGTAGSVLLLTTPSAAFDVVVPVLVLLASLLLAVQPLLTRRLRRAGDDGARRDPGLAVRGAVPRHRLRRLLRRRARRDPGRRPRRRPARPEAVQRAQVGALGGHRHGLAGRVRPVRPGRLAGGRGRRPGQPGRRVPRRPRRHPHPGDAAADPDRHLRRRGLDLPVPAA